MITGVPQLLLEDARGSVPFEVLATSIKHAAGLLHTVVVAAPNDHPGSFQHVVFALNHYLPNVGRDLVYAQALRRANLEGFSTLTIPIYYDRDYGVRPYDMAMSLRIALVGQSYAPGNQITTVNLVAGDAQSMAALAPLASL